jgi:hypothetical protein
MNRKLTLAALSFAQTLAFAVWAQTADVPPGGAEFARVSGGAVDLIAKSHSGMSGSLSASTSPSFFSSGRNGGAGYGATLGGTLVRDRAWFFASAESLPAIATRYGMLPTNDSANALATSAKLTANLGDRQTLAAAFASARTNVFDVSSASPLRLPSSFLALRYNGVISERMFVSGSVSMWQSKPAH